MAANASKLLKQAHFLLSVPDHRGLPADQGAEVAFAGRSNAGKSTALNALTQQSRLARVSKTPGRTQHLVVFELDPERRLIDLPGYGFANVPLPVRAAWGRMMEDYFHSRGSLKGLILCMDIRHPLTEFDQQMLAFAGQRRLACHILLSKADKLGRGAAANTLRAVEKSLAELGHAASVQVFSAIAGTGVDAARDWVVAQL